MGSPTADVRLNIAANSAAAQFDMMAARAKRMTSQMKAGTDSVGKSSKKAGSEFGKWAGGIGKAIGSMALMVVAFKGVQTVVEAIGDEFQKMIDLSNNAKDRQVPYQQRLRTMLFQSIPADVQDKEAVIAEIDRRIKGSSVRDKSALAAIVQKTISTMGTMPIMDRVDFGLAMGEARRDMIGGEDQSALEAFAGVAGAAHMRLAGEGSTPNAQLGLMQKTITASAVSDMNSFAQNLAPTINKLVNSFGLNQVEAAAVVSGFSTALDDLSGELTGTAAMNSMKVFREAQQRFGIKPGKDEGFFEQQSFMRGSDPKAKSARKWMLGQFESGIPDLTDFERENMSQAMLNKAFTPRVPGRAKTKFTQMQMVQPLGAADYEGSLNQLMKDVLPQLGAVMKNGKIDMRATYRNLERIEKDNHRIAYESRLFATANREQATAEAREGVHNAKVNTLVGDLASDESEFTQFIKEAGMPWINRELNQWSSSFKGGESLEDSLERQKNMLEATRGFHLTDKRSEIGGSFALEGTIGNWVRRHGSVEGLYESDSLRSLGFSEETVKSMKAIQERLDQVVSELQILRTEQKQPKKVEVNQPGEKPAAPAAAEIGK